MDFDGQKSLQKLVMVRTFELWRLLLSGSHYTKYVITSMWIVQIPEIHLRVSRELGVSGLDCLDWYVVFSSTGQVDLISVSLGTTGKSMGTPLPCHRLGKGKLLS